MTPSSPSWQVFTTGNSGLSSNTVTDIVEDVAGNIWFATHGGLCRLSADCRDWRTYRSGEGGLINDYVGAICTGADDLIWAVCDARQADGAELPGGLCALQPDGAWRTYPRDAGEDCIRVVEVDRAGRLWCRTGGLALGDSVTRCEGMREGPSRYTDSHCLAFDGTTWHTYATDRDALAAWYPYRPSAAQTRLGWGLTKDAAWLAETVSFNPTVPNPTVLAPPSEPALPLGLLGLSSMVPGMGSFLAEYNLLSYDRRDWRTHASAPSPCRWGELVVDTRGHVWVSLITLGDIVIGSGVARYDGQNWTRFDRSSGFPSDHVHALTADSRGNVWVSHMLGDLSCWDGARWFVYPGKQDGRPDHSLGRGVEDHQGRLWFPSRAGAIVCAL